MEDNPHRCVNSGTNIPWNELNQYKYKGKKFDIVDEDNTVIIQGITINSINDGNIDISSTIGLPKGIMGTISSDVPSNVRLKTPTGQQITIEAQSLYDSTGYIEGRSDRPPVVTFRLTEDAPGIGCTLSGGRRRTKSRKCKSKSKSRKSKRRSTRRKKTRRSRRSRRSRR
jgi:hypothetical protein